MKTITKPARALVTFKYAYSQLLDQLDAYLQLESTSRYTLDWARKIGRIQNKLREADGQCEQAVLLRAYHSQIYDAGIGAPGRYSSTDWCDTAIGIDAGLVYTICDGTLCRSCGPVDDLPNMDTIKTRVKDIIRAWHRHGRQVAAEVLAMCDSLNEMRAVSVELRQTTVASLHEPVIETANWLHCISGECPEGSL